MFVYIPNFFYYRYISSFNQELENLHYCSSEVIGRTRIHIALRCFSFSLIQELNKKSTTSIILQFLINS